MTTTKKNERQIREQTTDIESGLKEREREREREKDKQHKFTYIYICIYYIIVHAKHAVRS